MVVAIGRGKYKLSEIEKEIYLKMCNIENINQITSLALSIRSESKV